jgi:putative transposase
VFVERLWRSLKRDEVYLKNHQRVSGVRAGIGAYYRFNNEESPQRALEYRTPREACKSWDPSTGVAKGIGETRGSARAG